MRSIGKVNIRRVKQIIDKEYAKKVNMSDMCLSTENLTDIVLEQLPGLLDTWESAYTELQRIIDDYTWSKIKNR